MASRFSLWKRPLLEAYYYATLPLRRWQTQAASRAGRAAVMVIFYHRVADETPNDWTISRRYFTRQIDWLAENFDLVSLSEAQDRLRTGNPRPAVSITFDDGYADNSDFALPLLIERQIPCTYFVASDFVIRGEPFPHDVAAGAPLAPNTIEQLRELAAAGVEIGGHTRTHADLGRLASRAHLHDEIVGGRDALQDALGCEIRYFAFPYGLLQNLSPVAFEVCRRTGFAGVCSAYGGYNFPGDDPFHLQRIHADPQLLRLKNWLTVDPRKRRVGREVGAQVDLTT